MKPVRKLLIGLVILLPLFTAAATAEIITPEEVNNLSRQAVKDYNFFIESTFLARTEYIFFDDFSPGKQRKTILKRAGQAREKLLETLNHQKELREKIESYEGEDWDSHYGANGLWRKLVCYICETGTFKLEIDYYRYLFSTESEKAQIRGALESELDKQFDCQSNWRRLLKARCLFLLDDDEKASQILDELINSQTTGESIRRRAELLKLKHRSPSQKEIKKIASQITNTQSSADIEFAISVMAELKKLTKKTALKKAIKEIGKPAEYLYSLAEYRLSNFHENDRVSEVTLLDTRLACIGFLEGVTGFDGKILLELRENKNLRCPLLLYCCSKLTEDEDESVGYLLECIKLAETHPESWLDTERDGLTEQILTRTYNSLVKGNISCETGEEVFSFCLDKLTPGGEYNLKFEAGCGLLFCGAKQKGTDTLAKLWNNENAGIWRHRARLEILKHKASGLTPADSDYAPLLSKTQDLVAQCSLRSQKEYRELLKKCANFHCELLADKGDRESAEKILKELSLFESLTDRQLILKSRAYTILDKYTATFKTLIKIRNPELRKSAGLYYPLYEIISRIEIGEEKEILDTAGKQVLLTLAENLSKSFENRQTDVLFAEALVSLSDKTGDIKKASELIKNISGKKELDWLRCRAKLLVTGSDFKAAAEKWVTIRNLIKDSYQENYKENWFWWQSRYYEFFCWSKLPDTSASEVMRVIEVMENNTAEQPFPWGKKLSTLKNRLKTGVTVN